MKLVVSFYGMCLCVLDKRTGNRAGSASVLLLNGAAPASRTGAVARPALPYHHPLIFVPARHVDLARTSWSPVPAPETLVDTEHLVSGKTFAWSLAGLSLTVGRNRGITMFENQTAGPDGLLPNPASPLEASAWLDWRRIPDLALMAPGARLRRAYTRVGAQVLGIVRIPGGELRGAARKNAAGGAAPWRFSSSYAQVITDRFEFHCEAPAGALRAIGYAGGKPQAIHLKGGDRTTVRLSVIHEASSADIALHRAARPAVRAAKAARPELPHYTAFFDAFEGGGVEGLGAPQQAAANPRARLPVIDNPDCPPALF